MCGVLATINEGPWPEGFFTEIGGLPSAAKEEVRRLLQDAPWYDSNALGRLEWKIMQPVTTQSAAYPFFADLATLGTSEELSGVGVIELANPLLQEDTIEALLEGVETTPLAKSMLAANPNRNKKRQITIADWNPYLLATAKYGDLKDADVERRIVNQFIKGGCKSESLTSQALKFLVRRNDLTETLTAGLNARVEPEDYYTLSRTDAHREFYKKTITSTQAAVEEAGAPLNRLSPEMPPAALVKAFNGLHLLPASQDARSIHMRMADIALHQNAPAELMEKVIQGKNPGFIATSKYFQESRFAEMAIAVLIDIWGEPGVMATPAIFGTLASATPEGLATMFDFARTKKRSIKAKDGSLRKIWQNDCMALMSHPKFPWERYSGSTIAESIPQSQIGAAIIAISLAEQQDAPQTKLVCEDEQYASARLFSEKLSSRKVEQIARQNPGLAIWCALHPNGEDVHLAESEKRRRHITEFRRKFAPVEMAGKGSSSVFLPESTLQI